MLLAAQVQALAKGQCGFDYSTVCEANVTAEGVAPTKGRAATDYCEEALLSAKSRAVGEAVGTYVTDENTLIDESFLISNTTLGMKGFVTCQRVVDEWQDEYGVYHVKIEAMVSEQNTRDAIKSITPDDSVIVLLDETSMEKPVQPAFVSNSIIDALIQEGYTVKDVATLRKVLERDKAMAAAAGDVEALRDLSFKYLANVVISGKIYTEQGQDLCHENSPMCPSNPARRYSAYARISGKAIVQDTGDILCVLDMDSEGNLLEEKGFGRDWENAGRDALQWLAKSVREHVLKKCTVKEPEDAHWIDVIIEGLPDTLTFQRVSDYLRAMPWIRQVEDTQYAQEATTFKILYPGKATNIVYRLDLTDYLKVASFSENRIRVVYIKK